MGDPKVYFEDGELNAFPVQNFAFDFPSRDRIRAHRLRGKLIRLLAREVFAVLRASEQELPQTEQKPYPTQRETDALHCQPVGGISRVDFGFRSLNRVKSWWAIEDSNL